MEPWKDLNGCSTGAYEEDLELRTMRLERLKPLNLENDKSHGPQVCMLLQGKLISPLWIRGSKLGMQLEGFWETTT